MVKLTLRVVNCAYTGHITFAMFYDFASSARYMVAI